MSWLTSLLGGGSKSPADAAAAQAAAQAAAERARAWEIGLTRGPLPAFVTDRLAEAGAGKRPWISTMTPVELLLSKTHGLRPLATVTGTCWYQYGRSWTEGHAEGWSLALQRIREEAVACGANAVVDVKLRTAAGEGASMDFTLVGTAVRMLGLPPSPEPVIATVPAIEFVRLLEMGVVPTGLAVGARYDWLVDYNKAYGGGWTWNNQPLSSLGSFWEQLRRSAHYDLKRDAARQGTGVLAHTQFGQLIKQEGGDNNPDRYLGRHIVIGTVVHTQPGTGVPHDITTVVDMRDELSPLINPSSSGHNAYETNEREGAI
jgi:hypothetical protein